MTSPIAIIALLFFVNACIFALLSLRFFFVQRRFFKTALQLPGTVTDNFQVAQKVFGVIGKKKILYQPRFAFELPSGEKKFFIFDLARPRIKYPAGSTVTLYVNPYDATDVLVDEFRSKWSFVTLLLAVALASTLAGISLARHA